MLGSRAVEGEVLTGNDVGHFETKKINILPKTSSLVVLKGKCLPHPGQKSKKFRHFKGMNVLVINAISEFRIFRLFED